MSNICFKTGQLCLFSNIDGECTITACRKPVSSKVFDMTKTVRYVHEPIPENVISSIQSIPRSYEEIRTEEINIQKVVDFLEECGIRVKTEYGYYRDTYDILKDVSEHLDQLKNRCLERGNENL